MIILGAADTSKEIRKKYGFVRCYMNKLKQLELFDELTTLTTFTRHFMASWESLETLKAGISFLLFEDVKRFFALDKSTSQAVGQ